MTNDELTQQIMRSIAKCTPRDIGHILYARELVSSVQSGDTTVRRTLKSMAYKKEVKLEKIGKRGVYMLPKLTGYGEHDELLTKAFVEILKHYDAEIFRERLLEDLALRPDGIVLVKDGERKCCLIIEVLVNETVDFFAQKASVWKSSVKAPLILTELFGVKIPYFHLVTFNREIQNYLTLHSAIEKMLAE